MKFFAENACSIKKKLYSTLKKLPFCGQLLNILKIAPLLPSSLTGYDV